MINEELKEKTIKWICLEAEIMTKVYKMIENEKIDKDEWHIFLKKTIEKYGTKDMLINFERYISFLEFLGQTIKTEREKNDK